MYLSDTLKRKEHIKNKLFLITNSSRKDYNLDQVFNLIDEEAKLSLIINDINYNSIVDIDGNSTRLINIIITRKALNVKLKIIEGLMTDNNSKIYDENLWRLQNKLFEEKIILDRIISIADNTKKDFDRKDD